MDEKADSSSRDRRLKYEERDELAERRQPADGASGPCDRLESPLPIIDLKKAPP